MGRPTPAPECCLIVGMISAWPELFTRATEALAKSYGPIRMESPEWAFDFSDYYRNEMGAALRRRFIVFERLIDPGDLAEIKLAANALEEKLATPEFPVARPINLDPGWLDLSRLILATTKDHAHRIYLGKGIYAEVTLTYRGGDFQPSHWTYPDYRTEHYRAFLRQVRADFHARIKERIRR